MRDNYATAVILQNAVESVAHTAKYIGTEIEESRLIKELVEIMSHSYFFREARES